MNPERPQSSAHVDLKDPIQIHLLTETALTDSKEYQILSQEEIDDLKKQCQTISQRIEVTRSNLLIQSKYRDAAISMAKLYSPTKGVPEQMSDQDREAEMEREECERKCEELASELFYLEKRIMEPKRKLLEHTAGILQLTHKASSRRAMAPNGQPLNGVPGSPESMYTYTQGRNSLDGPDDFYTDDTSFRGFDGLDTRGPRKNAIEIPMKSPIREQQSQLSELVGEMERKLENLNGSLRDTVVRFNPTDNAEFEGPPMASGGAKPGDMLRSQIEYLESGLMAVQAEQESGSRGGGGAEEKELQLLWDLIQSGYTGIKQQKDERRQARAERGLEDDESDDDGIDLSETYTIFNFSSRVRWLYRQATMLKDQKSVLKRQIKQQRELNNKSDAEKDAELANKQEELEQNQLILDRAEKDAMEAQKMLSEALEDLEKARAEGNNSESVQALENKLQQVQRELDDAEAESQGTQKRLASVDASITNLNTQLEEATESREKAEQRAEDLQKQYDDLNLEYAELKTEVTIARAELDGAYGTRAERAADVAAAQTTNEVDRLREELAATAKELEDVTKETIASEREKTDLEAKLDDALAVKSEVEGEMNALRERLDEETKKSRERVSKLQEELDGEKLRAGRGSGEGSRPGAGASMLSEQFRSTMREERKKYQEDIRVSLPHLECKQTKLTSHTGGTSSQPQARRGTVSSQAVIRPWQESSQPTEARQRLNAHLIFLVCTITTTIIIKHRNTGVCFNSNRNCHQGNDLDRQLFHLGFSLVIFWIMYVRSATLFMYIKGGTSGTSRYARRDRKKQHGPRGNTAPITQSLFFFWRLDGSRW